MNIEVPLFTLSAPIILTAALSACATPNLVDTIGKCPELTVSQLIESAEHFDGKSIQFSAYLSDYSVASSVQEAYDSQKSGQAGESRQSLIISPSNRKDFLDGVTKMSLRINNENKYLISGIFKKNEIDYIIGPFEYRSNNYVQNGEVVGVCNF